MPNPKRSPVRRATIVGALALAVPALASCGFAEDTNQLYVPSEGTLDRDAAVDVLNAAIVSTEGGGEGTFVAGFANNDTAGTASVDGLAGDLTADFSPLELPAGGFVQLASSGGVPVTGEFEIGDFVEVQIAYSTGEEVSLDVPVVPNSGDFAGVDGDTPTEFEEFPTEELYTPADEVVPEGSEVE